jgi:hypothetical protein
VPDVCAFCLLKSLLPCGILYLVSEREDASPPPKKLEKSSKKGLTNFFSYDIIKKIKRKK